MAYVTNELQNNIPNIFTYNIELFLKVFNKRQKILMYIYNKLLILEHDLMYAISNNNFYVILYMISQKYLLM